MPTVKIWFMWVSYYFSCRRSGRNSQRFSQAESGAVACAIEVWSGFFHSTTHHAELLDMFGLFSVFFTD